MSKRDRDERSLSRLLEQTTVADLVAAKHEAQRTLLTIRADAKVEEALALLAEHDVLAAPVVDSGRNFLGFVDVIDACGFVLQHDYEESLTEPVRSVINYSGSDAAHLLPASSSVAHLVALMTRGRLHRLAVGKTASTVDNIVTQSDVLGLLSRNLDLIEDKPLSALKLVRTTVCVMMDCSASEAFRVLYDNKVSGIGLLDSAGHIDGCLSASDLRALTRNNFSQLDRSVVTFLARAGQLSPIQSVQETASLHDVIRKMAADRLHRLFIANAEGVIRGVVTISDVLRTIHRSSQKHKAG